MRNPPQRNPVTASVATIVSLALASCSSAEPKKYDIGPIFPLTSNKCEKYNGKTEGTGRGAHCWVTLSDCKRAAADWEKAMRGIDRILFKC